MRTSSLLLAGAAAVLLTGCLIEGPLPSRGKARPDCGRPPSGKEGSSGESAKADTAVYIAAVRFPESYDWRTDSARGTAGYEVVLLKDSVEILAVPSSAGTVSPDPDTHHIIGGHLYTEAVKNGSTVICRDGEILFSFDGREILKGLLPYGNEVYTLSMPRDGGGLVLRKNGTPVFERKGTASAFGDLLDPSYGSTGALYKDEDEICFSYSNGEGSEKSCYIVRDEVESLVYNGNGVSDLKVSGGTVFTAKSRTGPYSIEDGRLWVDKDGPWISGYFTRSGHDGFSGLLSQDFEDIRLCQWKATVYHSDGYDAAVVDSGLSGTQILMPGKKVDLAPALFLMTPACATACGRLFAAFSSRTSDTLQVLSGGKTFTLKLHGYFSGMEVSPPK